MKVSFALISLCAGLAAAAIGDLCTGGGSTGVCETKKWCDGRKGVHNIKNACPHDGDDVMCCFFPTCDNDKGYCDVTSDRLCHGTGGRFVSGKCPGPNNYQCCEDSAT